MRHTLVLLIALVLAGMGVYVASMVQSGDALRALELEAADQVESIMRAQDAWRAEHDGITFATMEQLVAEGRVEGWTRISEDGARAVFQNGGYRVRLALRSAPPEAGAPAVSGARYEVWAWPSNPEHGALTLFWGSHGGLLLQGENDGFAGGHSSPVADNPLKVLQKSRQQGGKKEWTLLRDVRAESTATTSEVAGEEA